MTNSYTFTGDLALEPRVRERLMQCIDHVSAMRTERMGWGPAAMRDVADTEASFTAALGYLLNADRVWIDGGTGLSFGGVMPGGIMFGMIARPGRPNVPTDLPDDVEWPTFDHGPIEWSFHS
jgi:hypothetical protein